MNSYPIENIWEKGHYVAAVTGPDPKYVVAREFLRGTPHKGRGIVAYQPADIGTLPAWIIRTPETRCGECGRPKTADAELIAAHEIGWEIVDRGFTSGDLLVIWEMGAPGTPTAWTGERCECSRPIPATATRCERCEETAETVTAAAALGADKEDPF